MSAELPHPEGTARASWERLAHAECGYWLIPERDPTGEIIGYAIRGADGKKSFRTGGRRGLIVPWPLDPYAGSSREQPIYVCEGASDTAALLSLGLDAIGVPMAGHCIAMVAELLADRHTVVIGDKDDAGQRGARALADGLFRGCATVKVSKPPRDAKDVRAAVLAGADRTEFENLARAASIHAPDRDRRDFEGPNLICVSDVTSEPVEWLWRGKIARGKVSLLAGDPGLGKSLLALDLAARVSRGRPMPGESEPTKPGGVVLLNAEDDIASTIRPRLDAGGADCDRITFLDGVRDRTRTGKIEDGEFELDRHVRHLETAIAQTPGCGLCIIDPISAFLGETNSHNNAEVRSVLKQLAAVAARHRVAVVVVTHRNKSQGGPAISRPMGSLAFIAAARAGWLVARDPNDPERRLLLCIKNNLGKDNAGLAFRVVSRTPDNTPTIEWDPKPILMNADQLEEGSRPRERSVLDDACDWLVEFLAGGPRPTVEVKSEGTEAGFSSSTLDRAKARLAIVVFKSGFGGKWFWRLPGDDQDPGPTKTPNEDDPTPGPECLQQKSGFLGDSESKALSASSVSAFEECLPRTEPSTTAEIGADVECPCEVAAAAVAMGRAGLGFGPNGDEWRPPPGVASALHVEQLAMWRTELLAILSAERLPLSAEGEHTFHSRLGVADDLGMETHRGSPAWLIALGEGMAESQMVDVERSAGDPLSHFVAVPISSIADSTTSRHHALMPRMEEQSERSAAPF